MNQKDSVACGRQRAEHERMEKETKRMHKKVWGLTWIAAGFFILMLAMPAGSQVLLSAGKAMSSDTIVLDPGHGGIDGGAVGSGGISEKDINLNIAKMVGKMAEKDGWNVILTRDKDEGLYSDVSNDGTEFAEIKNKRSIRSLKTEDLRKRKELVDQMEPALTVSIHLNSFKEDRSVHGAQSFYPDGSIDDTVKEESKRLAETIQKHIVAGVQDGTNRAVLGKKDMILFKNPETPIALIECGFLSNREEEQKLQQKSYQKKLAKCIYEGIAEYGGKVTPEKAKAQKKPALIDTK